MSDVILYKKQKEQLAKAAGKAFDALSDLAQALNAVGVTPIGKPEKAAVAEEPKKKAKAKKAKAEKTATSRNGGAFAEM